MTSLLIAAAITGMTNLTGVVTFEREGLAFFFIDDSAGVHWRVQDTKGKPTVKPGDLVSVTGEREMTSKHRVA